MENLFENEQNFTKAEFKLKSSFAPSGDQPEAIDAITKGFNNNATHITLRGVTGSGKTFTMANVIQKFQRPTLVISHNKTLAAQLYAELKAFFPENAVEYFISYYDYYQPEAYLPQTDTYIEKDASINKDLERFRLSASHSLLGRKDVIIVSSVSCIYGLVSPEDYRGLMISLHKDAEYPRDKLLNDLVEIQYSRNDYEPQPGVFRVRGDIVDIFPSYSTQGVRVEFFGDTIESLRELNSVTGKAGLTMPSCLISPAKQFVMGKMQIQRGIDNIKTELSSRLEWFEGRHKLLEAQRLRQRTEYDLAMLLEMGYCTGIENYSRPLANREPGSAPPTLIDYFGKDFLCIIDESHVTLPQIRAMYNGDQARKQVLVDNGFRLPSAKDNRPLTFAEFEERIPRILFTTATPGEYEKKVSEIEVEQVIRPTGLLDPIIELRPLKNQIDDLIEEVRGVAEKKDRILVSTLTKRSSEDLTAYLRDIGVKVEYLHSDIDAIERVDILARLRKGEFTCLVGINLLREGLDLPEVSTVAILDADKEGFLRSETSLIQTAGRCARHINGHVILYADKITPAIKTTIETTEKRRVKQQEYNKKHNITPHSVKREINENLGVFVAAEKTTPYGAKNKMSAETKETLIAELESQMRQAAETLEFERAALLRDEIAALRK